MTENTPMEGEYIPADTQDSEDKAKPDGAESAAEILERMFGEPD